MSNSAMCMMIITEVLITVITIYFFWRVLKTPPKTEQDSLSDKID